MEENTHQFSIHQLISAIKAVSTKKEKYQKALNDQMEKEKQADKISAPAYEQGLVITPQIDVKTDPHDGSFLVKAVVEKVIYFDDTSFFTVMIGKVLDFTDTDKQVPDKVKMVGTAKNINEGDIVRARGVLETNKNGLAFKFDQKIEHVLPVAEKSLERFLVNHVEGLGDQTAKKILNKLGLNAINLIQYNPGLLVSEVHLSKDKAEQITKQLADPAKYNDLLIFLKTNNFRLDLADDLYKDYGSSAVNKIRANPYMLITYKNVSFRHLDQIGYQKGFYARDYRRFSAAISFYLKQRVAQGNTVTNYYDFYKEFDGNYKSGGRWLARYSAYPMFVDEMKQVKDENGIHWEKTGKRVNSNQLDHPTLMKLLKKLTDKDYISAVRLPEIKAIAMYLKNQEKIESHIVDAVYDRAMHNHANMDVTDKQIDEYLDDYEDGQDFHLAKKQREAVHEMIHRRILNITGGAGFGKTTLVAAFIYVFHKLTHEPNEDEIDSMVEQATKEHNCDSDQIVYHQIALASPTGKAAHNLANDTGYEAYTIHKLLKIMPGNTNAQNMRQSENYLIGDYLIVDESSMIDEQLFNTILYALDRHMNLVLIGDPNQLPSVGAGKVFKDLIDCRLVPTVRLTQVFRQDERSVIFKNDQAILQGKIIGEKDGPEFTSDLTKNNVFIDVPYSAQIPEILQSTMNKLIKEQGYALDDIMVLTPKHQGIVGTIQENLQLQESINDNYQKVIETKAKIDDLHKQGHHTEALELSKENKGLSYNSIFGNTYYVGDRMIQLKNDYSDPANQVMNGSVGHVSKIIMSDDGDKPKGITVTFPEDDAVKNYEKVSDLKNIDLGYVFTVHKAQGSGSPVVICIVDWSSNNMLDRTLLYTAATRAKEKMIFIGQRDLFNQAVQRVSQQQRDTALCVRLQLRYKRYLKKKRQAERKQKLQEARDQLEKDGKASKDGN